MIKYKTNKSFSYAKTQHKKIKGNFFRAKNIFSKIISIISCLIIVYMIISFVQVNAYNREDSSKISEFNFFKVMRNINI